MIWLIGLCFLIALNILVSLYCYLRKKRSRSEGKRSETTNVDGNIQNSFMMKCIVLANDITFILFKITGYLPSHAIRKILYRYIFHVEIGRNVVIYYGLEARSPWNISIDDNSIIGDHAIFDARNGIEIGKNVNISNGVWIWTLQHDVNSPTFSTEGKGGKVVVKDRAWLSSRTSLLPNTDIEEGAVVAAGAVVTGIKTDEYTIYGGIPARAIAIRNNNLEYEFDGKHRLFI